MFENQLNMSCPVETRHATSLRWWGNMMLLCCIFLFASCAKNYEKTNYGIKTKNLEIQFFADDVVRVLKTTHASTTLSEQTALSEHKADTSFSVTQTPQKTNFSVKENGDMLSVKTSALQINLNLQNGKIVFINAENDTLLIDNQTDISLNKENEKERYTIKQIFQLEKDEAIYGLGQQQNGKLNQRGEQILLRQENKKICIPFIQSSKGYGLFWDNYSPTLFEDGEAGMSFESTGSRADYYFMYGKTSDGIVAQMRNLTGQTPMFPLWTYGYWQSRERYTSQDELLGVVKKYRELGVPLDGIIQDWQYWGADVADWNAIKWGNPLFPNPKGMIDEVHRLNAHIIISVWPSFGKKTDLFRTFKEKNMLYDFTSWPDWDTVRVYDAFNPEARKIYWNAMNENIFSLGMDGWWLDAVEPEHFNIQESDFDQPTYAGAYRNVYNAYAMATVGGVSDHQRAVTGDKRVFILTRSAFAGQQRYGAVSWSGDVDANWQSLKNQIPAALNFSLCGIPYWNSDIGGFFIREHDFKNLLQDREYRELYVRWLQFATFCPMMRSHGTQAPREIWQFGKRGGWEFDAIEKFINLRYQLLPYLYATAWEVTQNGGSFMRPLFADFGDDKKTYNIDDEYMFGRSLLIAPVTETQQKTKKIYLPKNNEWYDFWTNKFVEGGQEIERETTIDIIPVYVKAGSILPLAEKTQYATEKNWDNLELFIYPGANGEFTLYEDENDNYNYEKGAFSTIKMTWNDKAKTLTIGKRKGSFEGMLKTRTFKVKLINTNEIKEIAYTGNELNIDF